MRLRAVSLCLLTATVLAAQTPTFRVDVREVPLIVSVHDANGAVVGDLTRDDFSVLDSDVRQHITKFERNTSVPLSVAILIDTSASTISDLPLETKSVLRFIPTLLGAGNPSDTFALFSFSYDTRLESDYSRNSGRAQRAMGKLVSYGGTSLYDAVSLASETMRGRDGRHVMILVTDGGDTTSYKHYEDALNAAQRNDVLIYPLVVVPIESEAGRNIGGEHALATLADSTGGRIFYPKGFARLDEAFADVLRDLRTQYLLVYAPEGVSAAPGVFHSVSVKVARTGLRIRTRNGYYQH